MSNISKIILSILGALIAFLAGWLAHAWKNRNEVAKQVKKAISDLNKEHEKVLKILKEDYEKQIEKKDKIINDLIGIIDRLIKLFANIPNVDTTNILNNLKDNREKLHKI